jgi:hypothetical protein
MSRIPSRKDLKQLAKFNQPHCLTIYAPYIEPTGSTNPNKIMLKNLIKQALIDLKIAGLKPSLAEKTIRPVKALLEGQEFWPAKRESLVIFAHSNLFKYFSIPTNDLPRILCVEKGFNVEPLQSLAADSDAYMVLALDHKNVQLYEANRYGIKQISLKGFPASMYSTLHIDELPQTLEPHTITSIDHPENKTFHGQYNVSQTDKTMLLQFFRHINRRLHEFLRGQTKPLVIAGVGYLLPLYQSVNTYPHLVSKGINGSPSSIDDRRLNKKAWKIVSMWRDSHPAKTERSNKSLK